MPQEKLPHIVVATPSEYFAHIMAHGANEFPVYKGDWSGLWSEVKLNSPAMSADARTLQHLLPQVETLWSLLTIRNPALNYPKQELAADYADLFQYDEHNGAGQGGWPKVLTEQQVLEQNREYSDRLRSGSASAAKIAQRRSCETCDRPGRLARQAHATCLQPSQLGHLPIWCAYRISWAPGSCAMQKQATAVTSSPHVGRSVTSRQVKCRRLDIATYFLEQVSARTAHTSLVDSFVIGEPFL